MSGNVPPIKTLSTDQEWYDLYKHHGVWDTLATLIGCSPDEIGLHHPVVRQTIKKSQEQAARIMIRKSEEQDATGRETSETSETGPSAVAPVGKRDT